MTQVLPSDESFEYPDWIDRDSGTPEVPYGYFWYISLSPVRGLISSATDYADYPWANGDLEYFGDGFFFVPEGFGGGSGASALRTGSVGIEKQACVVGRVTSVANYDNLQYKATFQVHEAGAGLMAGSKRGRAGSSPRDGGQVEIPEVPTTDTVENFSLGVPGASASWDNGGNQTQVSYKERTNLWSAWRGNTIFFRVGAGYPEPQQDPSLTDTLRGYTNTNHYNR